ncbi:MAG: energy transducer TonB [Bryobacterales bacterium]|nr:energy transducer TonB [Bryobacterales bacterium]MBV9399549.1 energy transducer TonB [Bryobacterales bacterium]
MMLRRVLFIIASAALLAAGPRDPKTTFDLLNTGSRLSANDAAKLEDRLKKNQKDEETRIQLLSYYAGRPATYDDLSTLKAARLIHILWVIENDPKDGLGLFQIAAGVYRVNCQGDDLADASGYEQLRQAWSEQVQKNPGSPEIRRNAVDAIQFCSPEQAEQMLTQANDTAGLGRLYASAILGITGESYRNNDPSGSAPEFRARPFAEKARKELEATSNKDVVVAAATTLLRQGAILWADGKLDWDYTPLGNDLLTRATMLAPDDITLVTLPTALPARGQRPPLTIRVGGNIQSAKLVRKAAPVYPTIARYRGIEGIVQLTAVIGVDGKILSLRPDAGPAELVAASLEAVRQWEYQPTLLNGKPCYVITRIDVNYQISR